jgi:hypothetical protein
MKAETLTLIQQAGDSYITIRRLAEQDELRRKHDSEAAEANRRRTVQLGDTAAKAVFEWISSEGAEVRSIMNRYGLSQLDLCCYGGYRLWLFVAGHVCVVMRDKYAGQQRCFANLDEYIKAEPLYGNVFCMVAQSIIDGSIWTNIEKSLQRDQRNGWRTGSVSEVIL